MTNATRTEVVKTPITLDSIGANEFQKPGTLSAQVRMALTTKSYYPAKKTENENNGGLFSSAEFGFKEQEFISTENRVAWILVPEDSTEEEVKKRLEAANAAGATIYRVLSNAPILTKDQEYSIEANLKTLDDYANQQVMRYPETEETKKDGTAGKLILQEIAGQEPKVQYRKTYFWGSPRADEDMRGTTDEYRSAEIEAELTGAASFVGQTIS